MGCFHMSREDQRGKQQTSAHVHNRFELRGMADKFEREYHHGEETGRKTRHSRDGEAQ